MDFKTSVKNLTKIGAKLLSRIIGYIALGLLINLVIMIAYWSTISSVWARPAISGAESTPLALRLAGLVILLVILASPIVYFILGKKQGVSAAIFHVASEQKTPTIHYVLTKFFEKYPDLLTNLESSRSSIRQKLSNIQTFIKQQSFPIRTVLNHFLSKFDFAAEMDKAISSVEESGLSGSAKIERLSTEIGNNLTLEALQTSFNMPIIVVGLNLGLVWIVHVVAG